MKTEYIGSKLKEYREQQDLEQEEVVKALRVVGIESTKAILKGIEEGERTVSAEELKALCNVYRVDLEGFSTEEKRDLVALFKDRGYNKETIETVEKVQNIIEVFAKQKKVYEGKIKPPKLGVLWKD